tara:strand:+ start:287 stop:679 length:393 start_codon:yes stop_codon:yes gene_type:complete
MNSSFKRNNSAHIVPTKLTSSDLIYNASYNHWCPVGDIDGVTCKRIKTPNDYHGFLLRYESGANSGIQVNTDEFESLDIRLGSVTNAITDETYREGDKVTFDKGEVRELICEGEDAYIYCVMSKSKSKLP